MRFLNPKTDFAFKKIFGSEQHREVLLSFLNAILDLHLHDVDWAWYALGRPQRISAAGQPGKTGAGLMEEPKKK